jgi:hypothetical protein
MSRTAHPNRTAGTPGEAGHPAAPGRETPLPPRFSRFIAGLRENPVGDMLWYPDLPAEPWWDAQQFALCRELQARAGEISAEFYQLGRDNFQDEKKESIKRVGDWTVSFLYEIGGVVNRRNTEVCPVTTSIIKNHRTMRGDGGICYFSCLAPGTAVAPHRAKTNMRLRCHLGIEVPHGDCGIKVGNITRTWEAGRTIVLDDTFEHEAWNHTGQRRVVLIIDFWHPDLSDDEVRLLRGFRRYSVSSGVHTLKIRQRTVNELS